MRAIKTADQESRRKWVLNRKDRLVQLLANVSPSLPQDMLHLTVCCRYTQALLKNHRIFKYLSKHHPENLAALRDLLEAFERKVAKR